MLSFLPPFLKLELWAFLCGRTTDVVIHVTQRTIPKELWGGDYTNDPQYKAQFQTWVNMLWEEKDELIGRLLAERQKAPTL